MGRWGNFNESKSIETLKNLRTRNNSTETSVRILDSGRVHPSSSTFQVPSFHPSSSSPISFNPHDSRIHKSNRKRKSLSEGDGSGGVCTHAIRHRSRSVWDGIERQESKGRIRGKEEKEKEISPPLSSKRMDSKTRIRFSQVSVSLYG